MRFRSFYFIILSSTFLLASSCFEVPKEGMPIHIRAVYKNDPATSVVVGWNNFQGDRTQDVFYFDTVDHGLEIDSYRFKKKPEFYSSYKKVQSAFVELTALKPSTRYYFVIKNSSGLSSRYYVETLPNSKSSRISIIAGGDSRNNRVPRKAANTLVSKLKPHYVLFGGDMTDRGSAEQWWVWLDDWELTIGDDGRVTPIVPARGNHERSNAVLESLFWLNKTNYYALNIADGLIRTYILNSETSISGNQTKWLKEDLARNKTARWLMAQYHKPMRPHVKKKSEGTSVYKNWASVFYEYGVDLVFESDSHSVKSTWPIRPAQNKAGGDEGFVRDDSEGTVYVGEGCWGAPLRTADDSKSWTHSSGSFNQFKWVFVDLDKIEIRTIKVDNAEDVGVVDVKERFKLPENLDIWKPENGELITIK